MNITHRIRIITLALLLILLAPVSSHAEYNAAEAEEIWSFYTDSPWGPVASTDGVTVVWNENTVAVGSGDFAFAAIAAVRPGNAGRFEVARSDDGDVRFHSPAVDGDTVVWIQHRIVGDYLDSGEIWVRDFATGTVRQIAEVEGVWGINPQVDGDWIVWKTRAENSAILAYNLRSNEEYVVVPSGAQDFSVDDGYVVWETGRSSATYDPNTVFLSKHLDHLDDEPVVLAEDLAYVQWDYRDGTLVYRSYAPRQNWPDSALALGIIDVKTGALKQVVIPHPEGSTQWIATNGRYIFVAYAESYSDSPVLSLVTYDTWTDSSYITTAPGIHHPVLVTVPAVAGNLIAWAGYDNPWEAQLVTIHDAPVTDFLPAAPVAKTVSPGVDYVWFSETEHALQNVFKSYWESNGGLPVFGYPLTEEFTERNNDTGQDYTVQFTERQRFEWHPDNAGTPYEVLLGRLGAELLMLQGRDWTIFPKADPTSPHYFPETGHAIAPEFWTYWSSHGLEFGDPGVTFRESLALFGHPLTEPMIETNSDGHTVLTQYFERAVFEFHPDNHDPYKVLLRRLGAEMIEDRGWH
jgi:hypothetical protein